MNARKGIGYAFAGAFVLLAIAIAAFALWPPHKLKGDRVYFTDDDGQTWYLDDACRTVPCDHNGKTELRAMVFTYEQGKKTFCAYLMRYTQSAKKRLDDAVAEAVRQGKKPSDVGLFSDIQLNNTGIEVKVPGPGHQWFVRGTAEGAAAINEGLAAHADDSTDLVIPD